MAFSFFGKRGSDSETTEERKNFDANGDAPRVEEKRGFFDRMSDIQERVEDYLSMGVQVVWVVDPQRRRAYETLPNGAMQPVPSELTLAGTEIRIPVADIFAELDELEVAQP